MQQKGSFPLHHALAMFSTCSMFRKSRNVFLYDAPFYLKNFNKIRPVLFEIGSQAGCVVVGRGVETNISPSVYIII